MRTIALHLCECELRMKRLYSDEKCDGKCNQRRERKAIVQSFMTVYSILKGPVYSCSWKIIALT